MPKLRETQTLLWRLISAPEGAAAAIEALPDRERSLPRGIGAVVRGDDRLDAVARLDVYSRMYFFRLLECLIEDFPGLHAVIGHEAFHGLARDYLAAHPSEDPSVRMLGRRLGEFLAGHPLSREWCWLPDLARFEWALIEAFDAPDAAPLRKDRLERLSADEWAEARFAITPSLRILEARAPVQEAWAAVIDGRAAPRLAEEPTVLRVWREELSVFHRVVDEVERVALRALERGERFSAVCESAAAVAGEEAAAARVAALLERWVADAMIVGLEVP
jgi:hypothetical protein